MSESTQGLEIELEKLKQQIIELMRENTQLKEKEELYINFGMNMYYYTDTRFSMTDIATMYNICGECGCAHPGNSINAFTCCFQEKESSGIYIYCRDCRDPNKPKNSSCDSCFSDIYKCNCGAIYGEKTMQEYLQCCQQEKLASGKFVKCPYCSKLVNTGYDTCEFCNNDLCICDICEKPYQDYEEESKCCEDRKMSSGDFIHCKSCGIINKMPTSDKLNCKYCAERLIETQKGEPSF